MVKVDWERVAPEDLESLVKRDDYGNLFCRLCQQILPRRFSLRDPDLLQHWEISHSSEVSALMSKPKNNGKPSSKAKAKAKGKTKAKPKSRPKAKPGKKPAKKKK